MKRNPTSRRVHARVGKSEKFRSFITTIMGTRRFGNLNRVRRVAKSLYETIARKAKNESKGTD